MHTGHTKASPTPGRSGRYPNRSPIWTGLPASTSADMIASAASSTSMNMRPDLPRHNSRQLQGPNGNSRNPIYSRDVARAMWLAEQMAIGMVAMALLRWLDG